VYVYIIVMLNFGVMESYVLMEIKRDFQLHSLGRSPTKHDSGSCTKKVELRV